MAVIYDLPTWVIVLGVLVLSFAANELGFRFGSRKGLDETERSRAVSNGLKASILGLVALLLGFSYSSTSSRYYQRQRMALDEANAIGTCYLRAGLLSLPESTSIRLHLKRYTQLRLDYFVNGLQREVMMEDENAMAEELTALWAQVEAAADHQPDKVRLSQIVPAANSVIDLNSMRAWSVRNPLPVSILILLAICLVVSGGIMGHSSGQVGKRFLGLWFCLNILVTLVLFVVLDFDRPRRGLIQVDHTPLVELEASMHDEPR
ncbi:hypothetical protein [Blastopirellula marina]|uniref:DUF4239 domain-containing protein n=1 Tax=Blastopirellula marina TaxID=124 RepID=A0A2S8FH68_9BACT|nr:hypothetical protein [Blastopirellula marina]PQO31515.1 hypothetical protein C5Y98_19010 [Blastopirellula marina]PTL42821.1 hypothetical protein C5Y97_19020 [Blastopirellula marina]